LCSEKNGASDEVYEASGYGVRCIDIRSQKTTPTADYVLCKMTNFRWYQTLCANYTIHLMPSDRNLPTNVEMFLTNAVSISWAFAMHRAILPEPTLPLSAASIHTCRGNTNLDVEVLHFTESASDEPVNRCLGDVGHELRHPWLGELGAEQNVDEWLGLDSDATGRRRQDTCGVMNHGDRNQAREIHSLGRRLAVESDGGKGAGAQDGTPHTVHGGTLAVPEDPTAEEAVAVHGQ
jgi:hypothetical protein